MAPVIRGNSLYTIVDGPSWTQAEANSVKLGGHLVTLNNGDEDAFVNNRLVMPGFYERVESRKLYGYTPENQEDVYWYWIGARGNTDGTLVWTSGEPFTYSNWHKEGGPNDPQLSWYGSSIGYAGVYEPYVRPDGRWSALRGTNHSGNTRDLNPNGYSISGIAEIPLTSSITFSTAPKEGAGVFTTSINLSAGTTSSGNLAEGATVYWKVSGITADDLATGALTGSGTISNGKLDLQHSLKIDGDTGEKFEVSVFSDSGMTQQISSTASAAVLESTAAVSPIIYNNTVWDYSAAWGNDIPGTDANDLIIHLGGGAYVDGGAGYDKLSIAAKRSEVTLTVNSDGISYLFTSYGLVTAINLEKVAFLDGDLDLIPTTGDFIVDYSGDWADPIYGTSNNDRLIHRGGGAFVDGGAGYDKLSIAAKRSEVTLTHEIDGTSHITTPYGLITATNLEQVVLFDGVLELDSQIPTPPTLQSTTASNNQLILTFSDAIQVTGGTFNPAYLTVTVDGQTRKIIASEISASQAGRNQLTLRLRGFSLLTTTKHSISYNPPTDANTTGIIKGVNGGNVAPFAVNKIDNYSSDRSISRSGISAAYTNIILSGSEPNAGYGNSLNNRLTGNDGNNILDGLSGADILIGGKGDDTYVIDNAEDIITEVAGEGSDTVRSSITYVLGATLENLTLLGNTAINGTGNSANNTITGNDGANILNGNGGTDTLIGGRGNDTYIVDSSDDTIVEAASITAIDTVQSSISWSLGFSLENLTLTGTSALNGTGNERNNTIIGNSANNIIDGGSNGTDLLTGLEGADVFRFSTRPTSFNTAFADQITDFSSAQGDNIQITKSALGITASTATLSVVSNATALNSALSSSSLFVYNTSNGELHWNQNGTLRGAGSGGVLAILDNKAILNAGDLILV